MSRPPLFAVPLLCLIALSSHAEQLAVYDFNSTTNRSASTDANTQTTAGNFTIGPAGTNWAFSSAQNNVFARGNTTPSDASGAISSGSYFSFTITPGALGTGNVINLDSLTFSTLSNNGGTVTGTNSATFFVRSSLDGFASDIGPSFSQSFNDSTVANPVSRSVVLTAFQGITSSFEFRIYIFDDTGNVDRTPRVDNVILNGTIEPAAVPEPAAAAWFAGFGTLAAAVLRRRRRC